MAKSNITFSVLSNLSNTNNITWLYTHPINNLLNQYGFTTIFILGGFGNTFAIINMIYRRLFYKSQMFVFFFFMVIGDEFKLISECVVAVYFRWLHYRPLTPKDNFTHYGNFYFVMRYIGDTGALASVWVFVITNAYRLYAIVNPLRVKPTDKTFAFISCIVVTVLCSLFIGQELFLFKVVAVPWNATVYFPSIGYRTGYEAYVATVFFPMVLALYSIVSGVCLIILSTGIMIALYRSYKEHIKMKSSSQKNTSTETYENAKKSIMMLLPVSIAHITLSAPAVINLLLTQNSGSVNYVFFFLWAVDHSINVYLQMIFSKSYRDSLLGRSRD